MVRVLVLAAVGLSLSGCIAIPMAALAVAKIIHVSHEHCEKAENRCHD